MFDEREEEKDGQDESGLAGEKRERERHGDFHVDKIHHENSFQKFFPTEKTQSRRHTTREAKEAYM